MVGLTIVGVRPGDDTYCIVVYDRVSGVGRHYLLACCTVNGGCDSREDSNAVIISGNIGVL